MGLSERMPVLAHLIGAGGEVSLKSDSTTARVALEDFSPRYAAYGLDPAFVDSLKEVNSENVPPVQWMSFIKEPSAAG